MKPSQAIVQHTDAIKAASKQHGFTQLRVFGATSRGQDAEDSMLYLLAEALEHSTELSKTRLERRLREQLGVNVIVLTQDTLPTHMRAEVAKGTIPV